MDKEALIQEMLDQIGGPERVARDLEQFRRSCDAFEAEYPRLLDMYPDRWVAFHDGALHATGETLESVLLRLRELGIPPPESFVKFLASKTKTIIL